MDSVNYFFFIVVTAFKVHVLLLVMDVNFTPPDDEYVDFMSIAFYIYQIQNWNSFNVVLSWFKLFKYLQLSPSLSQLTQTLSMAARDISIFLVMMFIVFV